VRAIARLNTRMIGSAMRKILTFSMNACSRPGSVAQNSVGLKNVSCTTGQPGVRETRNATTTVKPIRLAMPTKASRRALRRARSWRTGSL
jgi:hypothetical protein